MTYWRGQVSKPCKIFEATNRISGAAEARVVKFCTQVKLRHNGRGQRRHVTRF